MGMFGMERVSSRRLGISPAYEIGNTGIVASIFWQTYDFIDDELNNGFFTEFHVNPSLCGNGHDQLYWISLVLPR